MAIYLGSTKVSMRGVVLDNSKLARFADRTITEVTAKELEGVTRIGEYAFAYCSSLTNAIMSDSVNTIGPYAFYYCTNLVNITLPSGLTNISNYTFDHCNKLANITIPDSVTTIGYNALNIGSSTSKATIRMLGSTPPTIQSNTIGSNVEKIIVDPGTLSIWQTATNWSAKASIMEEEVV